MAKMTQKRAVVFAQAVTYLRALGRISFVQVKGDESVGVARDHWRLGGAPAQRKPKASWIFRLGNDGQLQRMQREQQTTLGRLHVAQEFTAFGARRGFHIEAASQTQAIFRV